jgi:bifunctional oligoribonuclease and PAP phosphatase NrnA
VRYGLPQWDEAVTALSGADEVAIACHVNPDGDALGSLLAASLGLRKLGKKTYPTWGTTPAQVPASYAFLPGLESLVQPADLPATETFLVVDCGSADRLGDAEGAVGRSSTVVNVDHHRGNGEFGTFNLVVPTASSTAELMTFLLADLEVPLDLDIATCLYTGIVTDTGRFQYTNSSPETLRLAADLLAFGVPAAEIAGEVFDSSPFGYLKLVGRVLDRARLLEAEGFVYSWIAQQDLQETGVIMEETEKVIDLIRGTRAADVAGLFKEQPEGGFRVSLRSKGPRTVDGIARSKGGGGHHLAAGFSTDDIDETVAYIVSELGDRDG